MSLPPGAAVLEHVGGGDINEAVRVRLADGRTAFVKTREAPAAGEYAAEAAALRWLAEPGALRTPQVLDLADGHLALEWIDVGRLDHAGEEELWRGLALTHDAGAPCFGLEPGSGAATFGSLRLPNDPAPDWAGFYAERRLLPLARMGVERRAISRACADAVEACCARLADLLGPPERPSRLHGDLWAGNVLAGTDGRPWLIDPSSYGGSREIDLAMLLLFGGPGERTFAAYEETSPPAEGWRERVQLHQLLPLLVHALLFGGSYSASAERAARRYAG